MLIIIKDLYALLQYKFSSYLVLVVHDFFFFFFFFLLCIYYIY